MMQVKQALRCATYMHAQPALGYLHVLYSDDDNFRMQLLDQAIEEFLQFHVDKNIPLKGLPQELRSHHADRPTLALESTRVLMHGVLKTKDFKSLRAFNDRYYDLNAAMEFQATTLVDKDLDYYQILFDRIQLLRTFETTPETKQAGQFFEQVAIFVSGLAPSQFDDFLKSNVHMSLRLTPAVLIMAVGDRALELPVPKALMDDINLHNPEASELLAVIREKFCLPKQLQAAGIQDSEIFTRNAKLYKVAVDFKFLLLSLKQNAQLLDTKQQEVEQWLHTLNEIIAGRPSAVKDFRAILEKFHGFEQDFVKNNTAELKEQLESCLRHVKRPTFLFGDLC